MLEGLHIEWWDDVKKWGRFSGNQLSIEELGLSSSVDKPHRMEAEDRRPGRSRLTV